VGCCADKTGRGSRVTAPELEAEFLQLLRSLDATDRVRVERLVSGVLSGRVTLTLEEISRIRAGDVIALADALPAERVRDWTGHRGHN
jgi:hypothetical protein